MRRGTSLLSACLLACLLGGGLAACGEESANPDSAGGSSSSAASSAAVAKEPACADVWVDGQPLPEHYKGCSEPDGTWVEAASQRCDSGQVLVTYDDRYYGAMGAVVNDVGSPLADNPTYRRAHRSCG